MAEAAFLRPDNWVILRTSGRSTLTLAQSLTADGFEAWTPVETRVVRVPRMNAKREVQQPIMPSYVFARAKYLLDLLELEDMPVKPRRGAGLREAAHSDFSVMRCFDKIPLVADRDLIQLRRIEAKRTPIKRAAYTFPRDASARVTGGAFGGMSGVVVRSNEKSTVLRFGGGFPVEIPTMLLDLPSKSDRMAA